ncbi:uncharacterized protein LOC134222169 [Armigeres subalbatus]|uniref:uncharacterized protein LOC134222169 n=1 Tax=Armigeres subalbatus TaxID=124917 RepID=UPI002ED54153
MSDSETPRRPLSSVQRRNILDALIGSHSREDEEIQLFPTIAQQKQAQQALNTKRRMAQSLEILSDRQALLTEKLLRMNAALQEEGISVHLLHVETLRRASDEFEKVYSEMVSLLPREQRNELRVEYSNFEELHNEIYVKLQTRIDQVQQLKVQELQNVPVAPLPQQAQVAPVYVQAPVPHLQAPFPTFNGTLENWYSFKSLFQSIMARYINETDAMKILHLRNSLTGDAKDKIDQEVVNNSDYASAWKILEDAYEDKRLIMDTHIDAIMDCPKITKDNRDALHGHGFPIEGLAELILVNILYKKLDKETQEQWETKLGSGNLPEFDEFIEFLRERGRVLQRTNRLQQPPVHTGVSGPVKRQPVNQKLHVPSNSFVQVAKEICPCCKAEHSIYRCPKFQGMPLHERKTVVTKATLCFNCLKSRHRVINCPSEQGCKVKGCGRKHHSLLHYNEPRRDANPSNEEDNEERSAESEEQAQKRTAEPRSNATTVCANAHGGKQLVVISALLLVAGRSNTIAKCRALMDSKSDSNIITEKLASKLQLKMIAVDFPISGLNSMETRVKYQLETRLQSCVNSFATSPLDFLVVPRVTSSLPVLEIDTRYWPIPSGLRFADPLFSSPGEIDMIIGNELFFDIVKNGRLKLGIDNVTLAETELGWVVAGSVSIRKAQSSRRVCQLNRNEELLNRTMSRFWELESVQMETATTAAEDLVEQHFKDTHYREESGRYVVRLPFNGMEHQLGDSFEVARKRLTRLMVQLAKYPTKRGEYYNFLSEYLSLGHMTEAAEYSVGRGYFIPHHAVYKASSSTTKTRVVFDASAKTSSGLSLNETLLVGPTVQNDIATIILRFCVHLVVLTADISKCIDSEGHLKVYELQTVTYGVASSPYQATKVLIQLASDEGEEFSLGRKVIQDDSYIDDFLTGGSSVEEVIRIFSELSELLRRGGFEVHKFCSNSVDVLNAIPKHLQEQQVSFDEAGLSNSIKTLGLIWNPQDDYFTFRATTANDCNGVPTKRKVLSEIGQLFDPLGFLGPIVVYAKLIMQDIWRLGLDWDQDLPEELLRTWYRFRQQLPVVNQMRKPRCVTQGEVTTVELHGFSDASKRAYGAVVYVRSITSSGKVYVNLVASKSRVAPLKPMTIPRLELCGAKLLAELMQKVIAATKMSFDNVKLWCDSQIVLCWLKKSPLALNPFVANRVAAILEITQSYQWGYIRSEDNPADVISRGELPEDLLQKQLWWCGAQMLWEIQLTSCEPESFDELMLPELKPSVVLSVVKVKPTIVLNRLSSYRRIQRAWAYIHRYIDCKVYKKQVSGDITVDEIMRAEKSVLLLVQRESYGDVLKSLKSNSVQQHLYRNLALFVDDDGLIRVGGRLKYSSIPYDGKHQVLLPQKHHITESIVRGLHQEHFHVGQNGL